jgi:hypothetical protein
MIVKKTKTVTEIIQEKLQTVKDQEGILGYIMKDPKSASVDLKDPTKMIDYALVSSTVREISQSMTESLQIGEVDSIILESETTKLLSMNINSHHISLFMKKDVNHDKLSKKLV